MYIREKIRGVFNFFGYDIHYYYPRPFMKFLQKRGKGLVGAEVGVYKGENAFNILKYLPIKKLYLIDSYQNYSDYSKTNDPAANQEGLNSAKSQAHRKLYRFKDKIIWIEEFSDTAFKKIPEKLDFVYIDANHSYEFAKKDMENYYPLVKENGILAGHDIDSSPEQYGVLFAFTDFIKEKKLLFYINNPDWIVINTPNNDFIN